MFHSRETLSETHKSTCTQHTFLSNTVHKNKSGYRSMKCICNRSKSTPQWSTQTERERVLTCAFHDERFVISEQKSAYFAAFSGTRKGKETTFRYLCSSFVKTARDGIQRSFLIFSPFFVQTKGNVCELWNPNGGRPRSLYQEVFCSTEKFEKD